MARYTINYLTGDTDTIEADTVDRDASQYTGYASNEIVAHIPCNNVRSVLRHDATPEVTD